MTKKTPPSSTNAAPAIASRCVPIQRSQSALRRLRCLRRGGCSRPRRRDGRRRRRPGGWPPWRRTSRAGPARDGPSAPAPAARRRGCGTGEGAGAAPGAATRPAASLLEQRDLLLERCDVLLQAADRGPPDQRREHPDQQDPDHDAFHGSHHRHGGCWIAVSGRRTAPSTPLSGSARDRRSPGRGLRFAALRRTTNGTMLEGSRTAARRPGSDRRWATSRESPSATRSPA